MTIARSVASGVARGVASAVTRGQASGTASLDIRASVGTSTSPTSATTKDIALPFEAKAFLPFSINAGDGAATELVLGLGAATSASSRACLGVSSRNAQTTTATHRRHDNTKAFCTIYNGSTELAADWSSVAADKITLNWSTVLGTARLFDYIALGGADLEVSLTQQQMNGTNAAQSFAHGLSGAPTGVLFFSAINSTAPANTAVGNYLSIGAWAGSNQFGAGVFSESGLTTTATRRILLSNAVTAYTYTTLQRTMGVSSVDATNVNVTYPVTTSAFQSYFFMLAIRGAKCQVGTFDCNGSTSPLTIATTGITPKLFLPVFVENGVDFSGSVLANLLLSIGASDGTNNVSCGITDASGATTTNARRFQSSTTLCEYSISGTKSFEATAAFSGESVVLTPTTVASAAFGQGAYMCVGQ